MPDISSVYAAAVDLDKPIVKTILRDVFVTEDKEAHTFRIKLNRSGSAVDLSGAQVTGYFMRYKDRVSIPQTGSVEGDTAVLTLSAPCYNYSTTFALTICVKIGNVKHAVFVGEGQMYANRTDSIVDPEHVIPSIEDIIAQYGLMKKGTDAANEAAVNASKAAGEANTAAAKANAAAISANDATDRANTAAEFLEKAPVPTGTVVTYQAGANPDVPPAGEWLANPPSVSQGQYLWTRTVQSFTNGDPVTSYSVSRQGMDGTGSVSAVDGVSPDGSGNVVLGAVRSVNGSKPDADGNVEVAAGGGSGTVQSVNNVQPDDGGNITLTGENVSVSYTDTRKMSVAVAQNGNTVKTMTAEEFEALTAAEFAALYASGVRTVLVEQAGEEGSDPVMYRGYGLDVNGNAIPIADPDVIRKGDTVSKAEDAEMLGGKPASDYFLAEDAENLGGVQMELLWENASPNSEFERQEFTIAGAENYELFLLITSQGSGFFVFDDQYRTTSTATAWNEGEKHEISSRVYVARSTFSILFSNCMSAAAGTNATISKVHQVPLKIYGIKGMNES